MFDTSNEREAGDSGGTDDVDELEETSIGDGSGVTVFKTELTLE